MAKTELTVITSINLFLTEDEAVYLRNLLQNDLTENETIEESEYRQKIFEALASVT